VTPRSRLFPLRSGERLSIVSSCAECGQEFGRGRRNRRFCSGKCRYRFRDRLRYAADPEGEREKSRRFYRANREKVIARVTARYEKTRIRRRSEGDDA
jgi:hypothetical protein